MMEHELVQENNGIYVPNPAVIKVIGCGGGGSNAVNRMIAANTEFVEFTVINTDLQAINKSNCKNKLPIGQKLTGGLGAGGNPEIGEKAAIEDKEKLLQLVENADMVFVTAGMGGGTGTGSAPIVAEVAKEAGCLTVGVVTTPFCFEGPYRMQIAKDGIEKLKQHVDSLIIIPNEKILSVNEDISMVDAYQLADKVLQQSVQGITNIIIKNGEINTDFADIKSTMQNQGTALLGIGVGKGENRAIDCAYNAVNNPLLEDMSINGAKTLLINVIGPANIKLSEITTISNTIAQNADPMYKSYVGHVIDPDMPEDEVSVTVIATGFNSRGNSISSANPVSQPKMDSVVSASEFEDMLSNDIGSFESKSVNSALNFEEDDEVELTSSAQVSSQASSSSSSLNSARTSEFNSNDYRSNEYRNNEFKTNHGIDINYSFNHKERLLTKDYGRGDLNEPAFLRRARENKDR